MRHRVEWTTSCIVVFKIFCPLERRPSRNHALIYLKPSQHWPYILFLTKANDLAPRGSMSRIGQAKAKKIGSINKQSEKEGWSPIWGGNKVAIPNALGWFYKCSIEHYLFLFAVNTFFLAICGLIFSHVYVYRCCLTAWFKSTWKSKVISFIDIITYHC